MLDRFTDPARRRREGEPNRRRSGNVVSLSTSPLVAPGLAISLARKVLARLPG